MAFLQKLITLNNVSKYVNRFPIIGCTVLENDNDLFYSQKRYAARKGKRIALTREKQKLARQRREEMKNAPPKVWKPQKFLVDKNIKFISKKFNDENRKGLDEVVDNVYIIDQYKERKLLFQDAMQSIRETHSPTIYDEPNALVQIKIELDLRTKKKTKFMERFSGIVSYPNLFPYANKRKVVAISKSNEDQEAAKKAGAELSGSSDIIRMLKVGDITMENFDELVCHGDMLIELASIKGIIGGYFPTKQRGNIGFDMTRLVHYFVNGLEFKLNKDNNEPDYGYIEFPFGRLSQTDEELEENFQTFLEIIDKNKPTGAPGDFITRVLIMSETSPERFPVAFWNHIDGYEDPNQTDVDDLEAKAVTN